MDHGAYAGFTQRALAEMASKDGLTTRVEDVAEATWRAVTDRSTQIRMPAGADAVAAATTA
ncbi:hypothetical protein ERD78_12295 [Allopusillimonas soli]|uniref:Uncharacterized protein n=1 Tax=Allopusillimonas soli TaxID=659016 RepID=A0A853F9B0_9BURK|nr:hypothetical protein [Allopusillimonas soli]NYT37265.1 hypothetical protein [Allopusillimonas soli]TEA74739.1 hypothetical protein ERD78_12295 [Allopusillimonas soli]